MNFLSSKPECIFIGQAVEVQGTGISDTLSEVDPSKLIEFPVEEDFQLGVSIGLALKGYVPISIFPRWNFLLLAVNQLLNHLDKLKVMTGQDNPGKVLIRTAIGSENPLYPGPQHTGDFSDAFKRVVTSINVVRLENSSEIFEQYKYAFERQDGISTLLVELPDLYKS